MFLFPDHEEQYQKLIQRDGTNPSDVERKAMFYIFAGNQDLLNKVEILYDFEERMIRPECFRSIDLSTSAKDLVELAFNLYNNYYCGTVVEMFSYLDQQNRRLAIEAIKMRFIVA